MSNRKINFRVVFYFAFFLLMISVDQISKIFVINNFELYEKHEIITDFFSLLYVRNTGSAWSFLADKPWGIYVLTVFSLVLSALIIFLSYKAYKFKSYDLCLVLNLLASGAIANNIDRIRLHYVVDFLSFKFGTYNFPVFNYADICCVIATFVLIFIILFRGKEFDDFWEKGVMNKKDMPKEEIK